MIHLARTYHGAIELMRADAIGSGLSPAEAEGEILRIAAQYIGATYGADAETKEDLREHLMDAAFVIAGSAELHFVGARA